MDDITRTVWGECAMMTMKEIALALLEKYESQAETILYSYGGPGLNSDACKMLEQECNAYRKLIEETEDDSFLWHPAKDGMPHEPGEYL